MEAATSGQARKFRARAAVAEDDPAAELKWESVHYGMAEIEEDSGTKYPVLRNTAGEGFWGLAGPVTCVSRFSLALARARDRTLERPVALIYLASEPAAPPVHSPARLMPQTVNVTVMAMAAIVKAGKPMRPIKGTASAVMKPPPTMGRVMSCR